MIYFIKAESGHVKIGYTVNEVEQRLTSLQCGNPYCLSILRTIEGDREQEKLIQQKFKEKRCNGEWFVLDEEVENFINNPFTLEEPQAKKRKRERSRTNKDSLPRLHLTARRSFYGNYSLNDFLKKKEIRQSRAANDLGCSRQFVHSLVTGKNTPGLVLAVKIESWSNGYVPASKLVGLDEMRNSQ